MRARALTRTEHLVVSRQVIAAEQVDLVVPWFHMHRGLGLNRSLKPLSVIRTGMVWFAWKRRESVETRTEARPEGRARRPIRSRLAIQGPARSRPGKRPLDVGHSVRARTPHLETLSLHRLLYHRPRTEASEKSFVTAIRLTVNDKVIDVTGRPVIYRVEQVEGFS